MKALVYTFIVLTLCSCQRRQTDLPPGGRATKEPFMDRSSYDTGEPRDNDTRFHEVRRPLDRPPVPASPNQDSKDYGSDQSGDTSNSKQGSGDHGTSPKSNLMQPLEKN